MLPAGHESSPGGRRHSRRRRRRRLPEILIGVLIGGALVVAFGSVGVIHVMERRPASYRTPQTGEGDALPRDARPARPMGLADLDDDLVPLDAEAVRGVAETYRWDARTLRELARQRRESLLLDQDGSALELDDLVPSFLDGCPEVEPLHEAEPLPPVSASAPGPPRASLVVGGALLVAVLAMRRGGRSAPRSVA